MFGVLGQNATNAINDFYKKPIDTSLSQTNSYIIL